MDDRIAEMNRQLIAQNQELRLANKTLVAAMVNQMTLGISHLEWMTTAMKWREDDLRGNTENGLEGGYSDQLLGAIGFLENTKKEVNEYERALQSIPS